MNRGKNTRDIIIGLYNTASYVIAKILIFVIKIGINAGVLHSYHPIPSLGIRILPGREQAVYNRWKVIASELSQTPACVMDIGCNLGFYCIESAKLGHMAIGVDMPNYANTLLVIRNAMSLPNIIPIGIKLMPENIDTLPRVDYLIMLQIFHHLYGEYGKDSCFKMLEVIYKKFDRKLFFEVENVVDNQSGRIISINEIKKYFMDIGCSNIRELYTDEGRGRSLLLIEKQDALLVIN